MTGGSPLLDRHLGEAMVSITCRLETLAPIRVRSLSARLDDCHCCVEAVRLEHVPVAPIAGPAIGDADLSWQYWDVPHGWVYTALGSLTLLVAPALALHFRPGDPVPAILDLGFRIGAERSPLDIARYTVIDVGRIHLTRID